MGGLNRLMLGIELQSREDRRGHPKVKLVRIKDERTRQNKVTQGKVVHDWFR